MLSKDRIRSFSCARVCLSFIAHLTLLLHVCGSERKEKDESMEELVSGRHRVCKRRLFHADATVLGDVIAFIMSIDFIARLGVSRYLSCLQCCYFLSQKERLLPGDFQVRVCEFVVCPELRYCAAQLCNAIQDTDNARRYRERVHG